MAKQGRRRGRGRPMGHRRPGARGSGPIRIEDLGAGERGKRQAWTWYDACAIKIISEPRLIPIFPYIILTPSRLYTTRSFSLFLPPSSSVVPSKTGTSPSTHIPTMTVPLNASTSQDVEAPQRPKDVGILAMEMYFPQRVRVFSRGTTLRVYPDRRTCSASRRRSLRCSTASPRASTPLVLARSSWHAATTARISTRLH